MKIATKGRVVRQQHYFFIVLLNKCINNGTRKFATSLHPNPCELATENTDRWAMTTIHAVSRPICRRRGKVKQVLSQNTGIIIISIFVIIMTCVTLWCSRLRVMFFHILRSSTFLSSRIDSHNVRRFKYQTTFYPAYFMCALGCRNKICICSAVWPHIFLRVFAAQFLHYFRVMSSECHYCEIASLLPGFASDELLNSWLWNFIFPDDFHHSLRV